MFFLETRVAGSVNRWPIRRNSFTIGRGRSNDLVVDHESVSREHLKIDLENGSVRVKDLSSTNGLHVRDQRVEFAELGFDDWFVAGGVMMTVRRGIALTTADRTPSHLPGSLAASSGNTRKTAHLASSASAAEAERGAASAAGLASRLAQARGSEETLQALLDHVRESQGASGVVLLARIGNGWSLRAMSGEPGTPEIEEAILRAGEPGSKLALPSGVSPVLSVPVRAGEDHWFFVYPWAVDQSASEELTLIAEFCARLLDAAGEGTHPGTCETMDQGVAANSRDDRSPNRDSGPAFLAVSLLCRSMLEEVDCLADSALPVLIQGESGTGKELLARRLHARSGRAAGPFVALNCAALPTELLEAELFGIDRGVATGVDARRGRFLESSGGTLFLDEVGDLPTGLQPKILRALETGLVRPLGAPAAIPIDVRIVSATHQDLCAMMERNAFRRDLYHRLAGAVVFAPPLRDRREDILPLSRHILREAAGAQGRSCHGFDLEVARALVGYAWPGNVRELQHVLARALALSKDAIVHIGVLPAGLRDQVDEVVAEMHVGMGEDFRSAREAFERLYFSQLLERCRGNISEASRAAGLTRSHLYNKLDELGLR